MKFGSIKISTNKKYIVTAKNSLGDMEPPTLATTWEVKDGSIVSLMKHGNEVNCISLSDDSRTILTGAWDGTARIFKLGTERLNNKLTGRFYSKYKSDSGDITSIQISNNNKYMAAIKGKVKVVVFDLNTYQPIMTTKNHPEEIQFVRILEKKGILITLSQDRKIRAWQLSTGKLLYEVSGHKKAVWGSTPSLGEEIFISASHDESIGIWDSKTGKKLSFYSVAPKKHIFLDTYSFGARSVLQAENGEIEIFDPVAMKTVTKLKGYSGPISDIHWGGELIAVASKKGGVFIWRLNDGSLLTKLPLISDLSSLFLSKDGSRIIVVHDQNLTKAPRIKGSWAMRVSIWNTKNGKKISENNKYNSPIPSYDGQYPMANEC